MKALNSLYEIRDPRFAVPLIKSLKDKDESDFPGLKEALAGEGATIRTEKVGSRWNIYLVGDDDHQICEAFMKFDYGKFETGIIESLD